MCWFICKSIIWTLKYLPKFSETYCISLDLSLWLCLFVHVHWQIFSILQQAYAMIWLNAKKQLNLLLWHIERILVPSALVCIIFEDTLVLFAYIFMLCVHINDVWTKWTYFLMTFLMLFSNIIIVLLSNSILA
jgi:hypothetical protein